MIIKPVKLMLTHSYALIVCGVSKEGTCKNWWMLYIK